jgi:Holliday junction resolvase RusA-like endonuclease
MSSKFSWSDIERLNAKVFAGRFGKALPDAPAQAASGEKRPYASLYGNKFAARPRAFTEEVFLRIVIEGQIRGGKNNMIVTRSGLHFPKPAWSKWRDEAVSQVKSQLRIGFKPFCAPVDVRLAYTAGDKRRRDMPAIVDSIFHVLEKSGVVTDDTFLWITESKRDYSKEKPMAIIEFLAVVSH